MIHEINDSWIEKISIGVLRVSDHRGAPSGYSRGYEGFSGLVG
jgi:hypothetical protein